MQLLAYTIPIISFYGYCDAARHSSLAWWLKCAQLGMVAVHASLAWNLGVASDLFSIECELMNLLIGRELGMYFTSPTWITSFMLSDLPLLSQNIINV